MFADATATTRDALRIADVADLAAVTMTFLPETRTQVFPTSAQYTPVQIFVKRKVIWSKEKQV
jgi:hypothetical protein